MSWSPFRRAFVAIPIRVRVLERDLRSVFQAQSRFESNLAAIQCQRVVRQGVLFAGGRIISAGAVVPGSKILETHPHVTEIIALQFQAYRVIVVVKDGMAVHGQRRVRRDGLLVMQIFDSAKRVVARVQ